MKIIRELYQAYKARKEKESYRQGFAWACTHLLLHGRSFNDVGHEASSFNGPVYLGATEAIHLLQVMEANTALTLASEFPTMLRKMWSGGDVEHWLLTQADNIKRNPYRNAYARPSDIPRPTSYHRS